MRVRDRAPPCSAPLRRLRTQLLGEVAERGAQRGRRVDDVLVLERRSRRAPAHPADVDRDRARRERAEEVVVGDVVSGCEVDALLAPPSAARSRSTYVPLLTPRARTSITRRPGSTSAAIPRGRSRARPAARGPASCRTRARPGGSARRRSRPSARPSFPGTSAATRRNSRSTRGEPREVDLEGDLPLAACRPHEVAVLGAEVTGRSPSQASSDSRVRPLTTWTLVSRQGGEVAQQFADLGGRRGQVRVPDELAQRAVVVEQERPVARGAERCATVRPSAAASRGRAERVDGASRIARAARGSPRPSGRCRAARRGRPSARGAGRVRPGRARAPRRAARPGRRRPRG